MKKTSRSKRILSVFMAALIFVGSMSAGVCFVNTHAAENTDYTLTLYSDGEIFSEKSYSAGDEIEWINPEREGYTFVRWRDLSGKYTVLPSVMPQENLSFDAEWEPDIYYITLHSNGGVFYDFPEENTIEYESFFEEELNWLDIPEREGFHFKDWYDYDNGVIYDDFSFMPAHDIELYARWIPRSNVAIFDANGGVFENGNYTYEVSVDSGSDFYAPDCSLEKEGCAFVGWSTEGEATVEFPYTMPSRGTTFYAVWDEGPFSASFDANGGYFPDGNKITVTQGYFNSEIEIPVDPIREGYTFVGWEDESGNIIDLYNFTMPAQDVVIRAIWISNSYTITFDAGGGLFDGWSQIYSYEYCYGEQIMLPTVPEMEGYTFEGWVNSETGEFVEINYFIMPSYDVTLTAVYAANCYDVTFDANGGYFPDGNKITVTQGYFNSEIEIPVDPIREGYTFVGWEDENGELVEFPYVLQTEGVTFRAKYEVGIVEYRVEYYFMNDMGKYEAPAEVLLYTALTDCEVTTDCQDYEGFEVDEYLSVLNAIVAADGSTVLRVYYSRNLYTITYEVDGIITQECYFYGTEIFQPEAPEKYGYCFMGWTPEIPVIMPACNLRITAIFEPIQFNVVFDANGGDFGYGEEVKEITVDFGSWIDFCENPTKEGYMFAGWSENGGGAVIDPGIMDTAENKVFFAVWIPCNDIVYHIETYMMNTEGEYESASVIAMAGVNDTVVEYTPAIPEGFELNEEQSNLSGIITADGTLVLRAFLERKTFVFCLEYGDGYVQQMTYYYGAIVPEPATPYKEGYTFVEWADEYGEYYYHQNFTMPADDVILTATFTVNIYDIIFDFNNGDSLYRMSFYYGEQVVMPPCPVKGGYCFAGWIDEAGYIMDYDYFESLTMPACDLTFIAMWEPIEFMLTFVDPYGMIYYEEYVWYGCGFCLPEGPEWREGYTFEGWLNEETGEVLEPGDIIEVCTYDVTFTAIYYVNSYQLTFMVDDYEYMTAVCYVDDSIYTPEEAPEKAGYTFVGWTPEIPERMPAEDITFTAVFEPNSYTLVFNAKGGTFADGTQEISYTLECGSYIEYPEAPQKAGYTFAGWLDGRTGDFQPETMTAYDLSLVAVYYINSYDVKFMVDGKEYSMVNCYFGDSIYPPENNPVKKGYLFTGWSLDGENVLDDLGKLYNEGTVFYAVFEKIHVHDFSIYSHSLAEHPHNAVYVCSCGEEQVSPIKTVYHSSCEICNPADEDKTPSITIKNYSNKTTVIYGEELVLYASTKNKKENYRIKWSVKGNGVSIKTSSGGTTCTVTAESSGNAVITAYFVDENGSRVLDENGKLISDSEVIYAEGNVFSMIIDFFRKLFGFVIF